MPYLIAHQDDCAIVANGPTHEAFIHMDLRKPMGTQMPKVTKATLCTCGGVKVGVVLHKFPGENVYELYIPTGGTA